MTRTAHVTRRRYGPRSTGILMTPEEFDAIPESAFDRRYRYELIHGVFVVSPVPGKSEIDPNQYLGHLLIMHQENHPQGAAIDDTFPEEELSTKTERRRCDRAIWTGLGHPPVPEKDFPSIVIEFVSSRARDRRRDYEEKLAEYLAAGAREYWIIDRFQRIMTVYRSTPDGHTTVVIKEADTYQTDLIPGFVLPLARLLVKSDKWQPKKKSRPRPPAGGAE